MLKMAPHWQYEIRLRIINAIKIYQKSKLSGKIKQEPYNLTKYKQ